MKNVCFTISAAGFIRPEYKYSLFTIIYDEEKHIILTFQKLEPGKVIAGQFFCWLANWLIVAAVVTTSPSTTSLIKD